MKNKLSLKDDISSVKGVGPARAKALSALGIETIEDLIGFYPYKYKDKRHPVRPSEAEAGRDVLMTGELVHKQARRISGGRTVIEASFACEGGGFNAAFFNMAFLQKTLSIGTSYAVFGRAYARNGKVTFTNPEICREGSPGDVRGLIPVYHASKGISSNEIARLTRLVLDEAVSMPDWIDESIAAERRICTPEMAARGMHYPDDARAYKIARYRVIYEKLLLHQIFVELSRKELSAGGQSASLGDIGGLEYDSFARGLSFELTADQLAAIEDIRADLASERPMNRLIQGDVGSGKTAVAEAAIVMCIGAGYQAAYMAPTELLARQHAARLEADYRALGIEVGLLTSNTSSRERRRIMEMLADGELMCVVGTHSLIQDDVSFARLGLVITDEQHRFGVNQRKRLAQKGSCVNICVMSATPIPRTLANTVYGDMDFSIIRQKPGNRPPVITRAVDSGSSGRAYVAIGRELEKGHRAYVVAPSIDSQDEDLSSATGLYEKLRKLYGEYSVGLLHGRLDKAEKEAVMQRFARGELQVLASTVVIEVGIDVPEATVMVIENAERFGLSQLHQLRGRVGRSDVQSYCYLINHSRNETARERIRLMTMHNDGFVLSEEDYRLRGPGDITGTMQHGAPGSDVTELFAYTDILEAASQDAKVMVETAGSERLEELELRSGRINHSDNSNII